ncbi:hypothetical protein D6777_02615 [Candidatus Woesearchaeota archaeon]|nr:MAG: hypothetical protein D6777_02615 [Candidatus Woesearchaeota archaeon]
MVRINLIKMLRRIRFKELLDLLPGDELVVLDSGCSYRAKFAGMGFTYGSLTNSCVTNELKIPEKIPLGFNPDYLPENIVGIYQDDPFGISWGGNGFTVSAVNIYLEHNGEVITIDKLSKLYTSLPE